MSKAYILLVHYILLMPDFLANLKKNPRMLNILIGSLEKADIDELEEITMYNQNYLGRKISELKKYNLIQNIQRHPYAIYKTTKIGRKFLQENNLVLSLKKLEDIKEA